MIHDDDDDESEYVTTLWTVRDTSTAYDMSRASISVQSLTHVDVMGTRELVHATQEAAIYSATVLFCLRMLNDAHSAHSVIRRIKSNHKK